MSAPEPHYVKRPRLSLSCIVCRRRKVRCGREQPECTNCIRMNKTCIYKTMARDELTGRVRQLSPSSQERDATEPDPRNNDVDGRSAKLLWSQWTGRDANPAAEIGGAHVVQRRLPADQGHPTVPSWEEAMQVPSDHDIPGTGGSVQPGALPDQPSSSQNHRHILSLDYLSLRRGARVRYIGKAFWGFVAGQVRSA
jgi:hypothetical protein